MGKRLTPVLIVCLGLIVVTPLSAHARDLSIAERVRAQEAIERVYYAHRIGETRPFEEAVPRSLIERKVRRYLKQSAALEAFWNTPVTAEALRRELARIAAHTRFPERLREVYAALGEDPVLVQECFVRPVLVERLTRNFFAHEREIHGPTSNAVPEVDWDTWWRDVGESFDESRVATVAHGGETLPSPLAPAADCFPDDTWRRGTFDDLEERDGHSAVWTGDEMIVWGGQGDSGLLATGRRYDPLTDTWTPMSVVGAPTARVRHVAVWTGSRMVVWGGWDVTYSGTGGRYDPVSDSWTPVSTIGAPAPREGHTAVWTGDEMIVWGGRNGPLLDTGGRYDPVADAWTPTSMTGAPSPRQGHTSVWTSNRMVVWGGSDGAVTLTGGRYNPQNDTWTPTSTSGAPEARLSHTAVWTGNRVVIWGGYDASSVTLDTGGLYNPNNNSWEPTSTVNAPEPRNAHTAVWTGDVMVVWGGIGDGYLDTGGRYDPATDLWSPTTTGSVPIGRHGQTAVWTGSHMIVWGGRVFTNLNSGGRYDPVADLWTPTAPGTPEGRSGHTGIWTGTHMLVWGGSSTNLGLTDTGARYDPLTDAWTPTSMTGAPSARSGHTAVWTGEVMIVWGGDVNTGGRYNPLTDAWQPTSTTGAPSGRHFHTAVWTGDVMVIWGGFPTLKTGGRYDPVSDSWAPTNLLDAPIGRYWHTAVWTGSRMLVWGGYQEPFFLDTGGRYDPVSDTWSSMSTTDAPEGRLLHTAVWTGDRMIVWGGNDLTFSGVGTRFDTGGIYDPQTNTWTPTSTIDPPSGREYHSAVWTGREMVVWGGQSGPPYGEFDVDTGGRYNPQADVWVSTSTADAPSARRTHTAVWTGSDMLVWGGFSGPFFGPRDYPASWGKYALGHANDDDGDSFSECDGDCDDANVTVFPGAPELCDNRDNDCDGALPPEEADGDGDGSPLCADCDDTDPTSYPGAPELCDDKDNDCDTVKDEYVTVCGLGECTSTGYCSAGVDSCTPGTPSPEICDRLDNDCDGIVPPVEVDDDGDGPSDCEGDCDDSDPYTNPGAFEVNDGRDNQCAGDPGYGLIDEMSVQTGFTDPADRDAYCWPFQPFAEQYEASRSDAADQPIGCARAFTYGLCWSDPAVPPRGGTFFYLVRALCQYTGSLGADSTGAERVWGCEHPSPGCPDDF